MSLCTYYASVHVYVYMMHGCVHWTKWGAADLDVMAVAVSPSKNSLACMYMYV